METKKVMLFPAALGVLLALSFFAASSRGAETAKKGGALAVAAGKTVKVNYTLRVDGKIVDSSNGKAPMQFTAGSHQMIPGFEKAVIGMKVGQKKSFKVTPEEGYGKENPKVIQNVPKSKLPPEITPKAGMTLQARDKNGRTIPVRIVEVKKDVVVMNFNHPLAGKTLNFDVEVVDIK
jgi:FKBP-type peptidyl-prolyl cis-trans isomerase 2